MEKLKEVLRSVVEGFGYKAALSFVQGKDIFVSLPRGSGKCFCFYHTIKNKYELAAPFVQILWRILLK